MACRRLIARRLFASLPQLDALPRIDAIAAMPDATVKRFADDGAVVIRSVLSPAWVDSMREAAERNLSAPGPLCDEHARAQGTPGRFHDDQFLYKRHSIFDEFVFRSGAGALAARAMGSRTAHIFYDQLFVKEPGTTAPTPWHNDTSYWHLEGRQICSIWVALDDVPSTRGLSYVRGSHKQQLRHQITNFSGDAHSERNVYQAGGDERLDPVPDVAADAAAGKCELLAWDMAPGDVLIFNSAMLHGAPGNPDKGSSRRRGYASRWCGDDVTFVSRAGTMHDGWKAVGFDCGLSNGSPIACALHPNVVE